MDKLSKIQKIRNDWLSWHCSGYAAMVAIGHILDEEEVDEEIPEESIRRTFICQDCADIHFGLLPDALKHEGDCEMCHRRCMGAAVKLHGGQNEYNSSVQTRKMTTCS